MSASSSGNPTVSLGRFIKESRFTVPGHQRDYSWTSDYVDKFIDDIEEALSSNRETYFCGLMVFTSVSGATFKVLDGQQRLATTMMLFSAVRNWLSGFSEYGEIRYQVEEYLASKDLGAHEREPRLALTAANNDAFQRYVVKSVPQSEMVRAIRNKIIDDRSETLIRAVIRVKSHVVAKGSKFPNSGAARDYFIALLTYLLDQVQIVRFVLSSDSAAYTIFETLNDRGLALSPLDLVKNIFSLKLKRLGRAVWLKLRTAGQK